MSAAERTTDPMKLKLAQLAVYKVKEGELLSLMLTMGHRLGLFEALATADDMSPAELAKATGTQERWVTEWLYSVTAGGLVKKDGERFGLTNEMRLVLGEPEHPNFAGAIFNGPPLPETLDRLEDSFRTGIGFGWNDHGAGVAAMQRAMGANNKRAHLVSDVLAAKPDLIERLEQGIRVVDVGCGAGDLALAMAEAFPKSEFVAIDPSEHAIAIATGLAQEANLSNLTFRTGVFDDLEVDSADFITTFDVLHDLPFPEAATAATRSALVDGGTWLVADIKAEPGFDANTKIPVLSLFYSMSVMYCMNSALSEPGGAGLGTLGLHREKLTELVTEAGFETVEQHDFDFDVNNYYYFVN